MTTTLNSPTELVDVTRVRRLLDEDPSIRVLDVRTGGEFERAHIPGAYNVPLDTLGEHAREFANTDATVVLVCQSGARASQAQSKLEGHGKTGMLLLDGGMNAWLAEGGQVNHGESKTWAMDRQVRFVAGSISLIGLLVSIFVPRAKWLAGGVASGLVFSALSDTCAMGTVLAKLPYNRTDNCDIPGVLAEMRRAA